MCTVQRAYSICSRAIKFPLAFCIILQNEYFYSNFVYTLNNAQLLTCSLYSLFSIVELLRNERFRKHRPKLSKNNKLHKEVKLQFSGLLYYVLYFIFARIWWGFASKILFPLHLLIVMRICSLHLPIKNVLYFLKLFTPPFIQIMSLKGGSR